jgi:hypothetical protein
MTAIAAMRFLGDERDRSCRIRRWCVGRVVIYIEVWCRWDDFGRWCWSVRLCRRLGNASISSGSGVQYYRLCSLCYRSFRFGRRQVCCRKLGLGGGAVEREENSVVDVTGGSGSMEFPLDQLLKWGRVAVRDYLFTMWAHPVSRPVKFRTCRSIWKVVFE